MGAQSDRLRCEVCQNLILSPINTGFLRYAVATVLTVYGIETSLTSFRTININRVATVLTVYGIETNKASKLCANCSIKVATVLTVYGIETNKASKLCANCSIKVATVLTVYGIET